VTPSTGSGQAPARIYWPGHPLHGRPCTILRPITVDRLSEIGQCYAVHIEGLPDPIVLRQSQLRMSDSAPESV